MTDPDTGRLPPEEVEWFDSLGAVRPDWERLAEVAGNVFATWDWASLWWDRYAGTGQLAVGAVRDASGACRALLPLVVERRGPIRLARVVGHGTADELGPVCAPDDRVAAARALRSALADIPCDVLLAEHLPAGPDWAGLLGGVVLRREGYPVVRAPDGWDAYLAGRSAHWRKKMRHLERRLHREHEVRTRLVDDPAHLDAGLDLFFSLHRMRWPAGSEFLDHEDFQRQLAHRALRRGWLRLWFLELDGEPAAAIYGFRFCDNESAFQFGRDPHFERHSVGTALILHVLRESLTHGAREYRFLRGDDPYKQRFATADPQVVSVGAARGPRGRAALAAGTLADRLAPVRTRLRSVLRAAPGVP